MFEDFFALLLEWENIVLLIAILYKIIQSSLVHSHREDVAGSGLDCNASKTRYGTLVRKQIRLSV